MHLSLRRTLESSPIAFLLLTAAIVGAAADARAATPLTHRVSAPQEPPTWIGDLARLLTVERFAELEPLGRTEGTAAVGAQLAKDKEALDQAAAAHIEARGLTANSSQYKLIQTELNAILTQLSSLAASIETALTRSAVDTHQASQTAESDRAEIRRIVENALRNGTLGPLRQFGGAIEDTLAEVALAATHPVGLLNWQVQVLEELSIISRERALDVALELASRPGRGWAAAVSKSFEDPADFFESLGPLRLASGAPAPAPFDLALRLVESDEVHVETRATIALPFLAAGIDDARLLAVAETLAPEMRGLQSFRVRELEWWHDRLMASSSQEVRRAAVQARLQYADAGDLALLERLLQDADPYNRVAVASILARVLPARAPISPEYRALWMRALADPAMEVRRTASEELVARAKDGTFPLSAKETMQLVLALDDPTDAAARAGVLAELSSVIGALSTVATSNEELGQVYAALLESRLADVTSRVISVVHNAHHEAIIAVLASLGDPSSEVSAGLASRLRSSQYVLRPATAEACLRAFAHLLQRPQQPTALVEVTRDALREKSSKHSLDSLPPADAVEVLLRSAEPAGDLVQGFLFMSRWERCAEALAAAAADATRTHTERSLALIALERSRPLTPQSVAALAESIAAAFRDESARDSALGLLVWATLALDAEPKAHGALLVALLGRTEVPTAAFSSVAWTDAHAEALSADEKRALFDALEQRAAADRTGPVPFGPFALAALAAMERDPSLVRTTLVTRWSEREEIVAGAAAAAVRSSDTSLKAAVRARILGRLAGEQTGTGATWIAALIHVEGATAAADDVAELAGTHGRTYLVKVATELLESTAKLREVGARLANSSTGASRDAAVTEVVALLDAPDEAVRIEAIRGLATLGAVEHLPRLIRIVGKGTPAERTAARAALDSLHQRATRESAPVQAPPAEVRDQARDGEAPR